MKNSSDYIAKSVYSINAFYTNKQNKTKKLFFECLKENKSNEYFKKELDKIWGNVNHKFMDVQVDKLMNMVHDENVKQALNIGRLEKIYKETENWVIDNEYFKLTPEEYFSEFEKRFEDNVEKVYIRSKKNVKDLDSETYIEKAMEGYNKNINQSVTYFTKAGEPLRQVQLSTYLSMIHNTNLTRAGWNTTLSDSDYLDMEYFIIPYHSFSCPHCLVYQNRRLSKRQVEDLIGDTEIRSGDLLHPNCKCTLSIYWDNSQISKLKINPEENEELYKLRQKVNGLTLEKSRLRTDQKIAENLDMYDLADEKRKQANAINRQIREIKASISSSELRKQLTAIKR